MVLARLTYNKFDIKSFLRENPRHSEKIRIPDTKGQSVIRDDDLFNWI